MNLIDRFRAMLLDPPPSMAFEISEGGITASRTGARAALEFRAVKPGTISVSPLKENILDAHEFSLAVRALDGAQAARRRKDVALILPDFSARVAVLDFDDFPSDPAEQLSLVRFRLKRSVPFDVESAAVSHWAQPSPGKHRDVVAAVAPLEIVARYEAPFRAAGMNPGLVTISALAALELAPQGGLTVVAKMSGRVLSVLARDKSTLKLARCLELPSAQLEDVARVLHPTLVYVEDNLGGPAVKLVLCGFGALTEEALGRFHQEFGIETEPMRSPLAPPGGNDAGLLGYLRSVARNN
jgi:type IV pilus assembly protein PilM